VCFLLQIETWNLEQGIYWRGKKVMAKFFPESEMHNIEDEIDEEKQNEKHERMCHKPKPKK